MENEEKVIFNGALEAEAVNSPISEGPKENEGSYGAELCEMRAAIAELRDTVSRQDRASSMLSELRSLTRIFPDANILAIDEEGWSSVMAGGSFLEAYVLSQHRKKLAEEANRAGILASAGAVKGGNGAYFSLDEIRRMDSATVKQNLDKVLASLEAAKG